MIRSVFDTHLFHLIKTSEFTLTFFQIDSNADVDITFEEVDDKCSDIGCIEKEGVDFHIESRETIDLSDKVNKIFNFFLPIITANHKKLSFSSETVLMKLFNCEYEQIGSLLFSSPFSTNIIFSSPSLT